MMKEQQTEEDALLRRYLLGELNEEQRNEIEQRMIEEDDYFTQASIAEEELMSDYARGELTPAERPEFESRFLRHPGQRQRVILATALVNRAREAKAEFSLPQAESINRVSLWQRCKSFFTFHRFALQLSVAAALMICIAGVGWLLSENAGLKQQLRAAEGYRQESNELRRQLAEQQQQNEATTSQLAEEKTRRTAVEEKMAALKGTKAAISPSPLPTVVALLLKPNLVRSEGDAMTATLSNKVEVLRLQIVLESNDYKTYRAELKNYNETLFKRDGLRPRGANRLILDVPAARLNGGDYLLEINGSNVGKEYEKVRGYSFKIVKRDY